MALLAAGLSSCASEDFWDTFDRTIDGPIDFTVGVETSPAQRTKTRGEDDPTYYAMQAGTQVRLKVDGTWERKAPKAISKTTTCSVVAAQTGNVNTMSFTDAEAVYWDDYGAGDPENKTNTDKGVAVLGVAVDGMNTAPTVGDGEWESLSWPVITDGKDVLNGDIIVSNNLKNYKFSERNDESAKKMTFIHPLCKITFNIKAGEGFTKGTIGATANKFEKDPILTLSNATTLADVSVSTNDYVLVTGSVSIKNGSAESDGNKARVIAGTTSTADDDITVIKQAIVYPGTQLGADNSTVIAVLQADDNVYYVKAKDIHTAIDKITEHAGDYKTKAGYNYIINITVNKTGIRTTATVTNWNEVDAAEAYPVINVSAGIGDKAGSATPDGFTEFAFWRRLNTEDDYQKEAILTGEITKDDDWHFSQILYWHHHNEHYHFRGIFPSTTEVTTDDNGKQCVAIKNGAYSESTFPGNFLMGLPEFSGDNYMCNNDDHTSVDMRTNGICARTTAINMNFRYMMSQVEVKLSSSESTADNYVGLTKTKVELVNVGNDGHVLLSDRSAVITDGGGKTFELPSVNSSSTNYLGVIIPQTLVNTNKSNKVKFKITVYDDVANTYDVYYADVAPIKVKQKGSADEAAATEKWESGVHYVYNLKITKTEIKATATLTDWTTVEAAEDVWF